MCCAIWPDPGAWWATRPATPRRTPGPGHLRKGAAACIAVLALAACQPMDGDIPEATGWLEWDYPPGLIRGLPPGASAEDLFAQGGCFYLRLDGQIVPAAFVDTDPETGAQTLIQPYCIG